MEEKQSEQLTYNSASRVNLIANMNLNEEIMKKNSMTLDTDISTVASKRHRSIDHTHASTRNANSSMTSYKEKY